MPAAAAAASLATRLLPMPGGPTTLTTPPRAPMVRSARASRAAISQRRPTRLASERRRGRPRADRQQSTGVHRFVSPLDAHPLRFSQRHGVSTSRAVDSDSNTPPGGATDSIRWANPTVSPVAA